ncbi:MAG: hypothetical protein ABSH30_16380, partial [Acidimicrobiales bacterium]
MEGVDSLEGATEPPVEGVPPEVEGVDGVPDVEPVGVAVVLGVVVVLGVSVAGEPPDGVVVAAAVVLVDGVPDVEPVGVAVVLG